MIAAVTMNPAVDVSYSLDQLKIDTVNRVLDPGKTAGGKGLNVARVARLLGADVMATGFVGGHLGRFIEEQLTEAGINHSFCHIDQESRNCIAILHEGKQTEILEAGPSLGSEDEERFFHHFKGLLDETSVVTISGSLPKGISHQCYSDLVSEAGKRGIPVLLDTSGESLRRSLESKTKPYLIKPNQEELEQLLGVNLAGKDEASLRAALQDPLFDGVMCIVVSMGAGGAFARVDGEFYRVSIPKIEVINPVGSGDSTLAGMACSVAAKASVEAMLKKGMLAGMLNTMETRTGYIDLSKADGIEADITVNKIK